MNDKNKPVRKYKSHAFSCDVKWTGERTWAMDYGNADTIRGGPPPSFRGTDDLWSPEDLLLESINSCLLASFVSVSIRNKFEFISYESAIDGLLEHDGAHYRFTKIAVRPTIVVKAREDIEIVEQYIEKAHDLCFMSHSVNAEITIESNIIVQAEG